MRLGGSRSKRVRQGKHCTDERITGGLKRKSEGGLHQPGIQYDAQADRPRRTIDVLNKHIKRH